MTTLTSESPTDARDGSTGLPDWTPREFEARLRAKVQAHPIHHPFNVRLNTGGCTPDEVRCWVANHFYRQACIPRRDAAILANMTDRDQRRIWVERLLEHDGRDPHQGPRAGRIEAWIRLGEAVGVSRHELWSLRHVVPAVRLSCDADVGFASKAPWQDALCASLTDFLAPTVPRDRLATWAAHYPWIESDGLACFRASHAGPGPALEHALQVTLGHFRARAEQQRALDILQFRLDVQWTLTDAIEKACQ